jgi:transposase
LHLEDGFTVALVCEEIGVSKASLVLWLWPYRKHGEVGLQRPDAGKRAPKLSAPITDKIAISNRKTRQIIFGTFLTVVEGRRRS